MVRKTEQQEEPVADPRTSAERIEDMAFENRIRFLTHHRRWEELKMVQLVYASALADRQPGSVPRDPADNVVVGEFVDESGE